jgi:uncharacterized protein
MEGDEMPGRKSAGDAGRGQLPDRSVRGGQLLAALGIWVLLAGVVGVGTFFAAQALAPGWASANSLGALISAEVYLALVIALVAGVGGVRGLGERLRFRIPTGRDVVLGLAAAVVIWVTTGAVYLALFPILGSLDAVFDAFTFVGSDGGRLVSAGLVVTVLSLARAIVITPLAEELLFRGALFGWLRRRWPAWATILVSTAVFSAMHAFLALMPAVFVFGIVTAWMRERTGSIAPGFVAHIANNALIFTAIYVLTGWQAGA